LDLPKEIDVLQRFEYPSATHDALSKVNFACRPIRETQLQAIVHEMADLLDPWKHILAFLLQRLNLVSGLVIP